MSARYLLEWTFHPAEFFEEPLEVTGKKGTFTITPGHVQMWLQVDQYPEDHSLRLVIHDELQTLFRGVQVTNHSSFELQPPNVAKVHDDGRRDAWAFPKGATVTITGGTVDFVLRQADGTILRDSKRERVDRNMAFAASCARVSGDSVADALLTSYSSAVSDPGNELVHLYEIRDALHDRFGGAENAKSTLGISGEQWKALGKLADNELAEGRHRGRYAGRTRPATTEELDVARSVARDMIEKYLRYLESVR